MFQKVLLYLLISVFSLSTYAGERYVNSLEDFYMHMRNHVANVEVMADRLFIEMEKNPEKWKAYFGIPENASFDNKLKAQIKEFISLHDISKLNTSKEFLEKIKRQNGIINDLYTVYGKPFKDMTESEKKIVDSLNIVDKAERDAFIKKHNLPPWAVKVIDEFEKISDGVERGMNPVTSEEMAKVVWKESEGAEKKLAEAIKAGESKEVIKHLQERLELIKKMEQEYVTHAGKFTDYKNKMQKLHAILRESGVIGEYLDQFATYQLLEDYEKASGKKLNPSDPKLVEKLKKYFFQNKRGMASLKSTFNKGSINQAQIMFELGQYEVAPAQNNKWKNLFETFQGVCE